MASGLVEPAGDEVIVPVGPLPGLTGEWSAAGAAWGQIAALREANTDRIERFLEIDWPRAVYLLRLAGDAMDAAISPAELTPAYLRSKVAERPT